MEQEHTISYEDIFNRIDQVKTDINKLVFKIVAIIVPCAFASFVWVWDSYSKQAAFNESVKGAVEYNKAIAQNAYESVELSRQEMGRKLDDIYKFLREDSRELRESLQKHIENGKRDH